MSQPNLNIKENTIFPNIENIYKFLVFYWSADHMRICNASENKDRSLFDKTFNCIDPSFFNKVLKLIKKASCDFVVVGTENEQTPTHFHKQYLFDKLTEADYKQMQYDSINHLRLSVFVKTSLFSTFTIGNPYTWASPEIRFLTGSDGNQFVGVNIMINSKLYCQLVLVRINPISTQYDNYIQEISMGFAHDIIAYNFILSRLQETAPAIIFGATNFKFLLGLANKENARKWITERLGKYNELVPFDEFTSMSKLSLAGYTEGKNVDTGDGKNSKSFVVYNTGLGPTFPPTGNLDTPRSKACKDGKFEADCVKPKELPAWGDRIIYTNSNLLGNNIACAAYRRLDTGEMDRSSHAGVYGVYYVSK